MPTDSTKNAWQHSHPDPGQHWDAAKAVHENMQKNDSLRRTDMDLSDSKDSASYSKSVQNLTPKK